MYTALLIIYSIISVLLIGFVLVQQGKGANLGASFGGGASGSIFGARGAGNFLSHTTALLAIAFFVISLVLGNLNSHANQRNQGDFEDLSKVAEQVQKEQPKSATTQNNDIPQ